MMGQIKNKWRNGFYSQSIWEFQINDWDYQLSNSDYNIKYFLNKSCRKDTLHYIYDTDYFYNLLNKQNIINLKDFIYKRDKTLYYNITSWTMFQEWVDTLINYKYDIAKNSFDYNSLYLQYLKDNPKELINVKVQFVENLEDIKQLSNVWYIVYTNVNKMFQELIKEHLIAWLYDELN